LERCCKNTSASACVYLQGKSNDMVLADYFFMALAGCIASVFIASLAAVKLWWIIAFGIFGFCITSILCPRTYRWAFILFCIGACAGLLRIALFAPTFIFLKQGSWIITILENIRLGVTAMVQRLYPEPVAGFVQGLLLGSKGVQIQPALWEALRRTSTAHLIAVSGYNITIVANAISVFLAWLTVPRKWIWLIASVVIVGFTVFVGAPASAVRAAVMAFLVVVAKRFSRQTSTHIAFALTLAAMLIINPSSLRSDLGFQLSFLAAFGILYVEPFLNRSLRFGPREKTARDEIAGAVRETLAAQCMVFPILLYRFGTMSLLGIAANMFVLPFIPFAMAVGSASIVLGYAFFPLGQIISWSALPIFRGALWVISFFSSFPIAAFEGIRVSAYAVGAYYACFILWFWYASHRRAHLCVQQ